MGVLGNCEVFISSGFEHQGTLEFFGDWTCDFLVKALSDPVGLTASPDKPCSGLLWAMHVCMYGDAHVRHAYVDDRMSISVDSTKNLLPTAH